MASVPRQYILCVLVLIGIASSTENQGTEDVCLIPGCIHAASGVLENLDLEIAPCDDFYQFACGNFIKTTVLPEYLEVVHQFSLLSHSTLRKLTLILREENESDLRSFKLSKKLYAACMNTTRIAERGNKPITEFYKRIGGCPMVEGESWKPINWLDLVKNINAIWSPIEPVISIAPTYDIKMFKKLITITQFGGVGQKTPETDDEIEAKVDTLTKFAINYGAIPESARNEIKDVVLFISKLEEIRITQQDVHNTSELNVVKTIDELQQHIPKINWLQLINCIFPADAHVNETQEILVDNLQYWRDFAELVTNTTERTLANYLILIATSDTVELLSATDMTQRWKECIEMVKKTLPIPLNALYIRKHFDMNSKQTALDMTREIQAQFEHIINNIEWMDNETRKAAIKKLNAMGLAIGFPDEMLDDSKIEEETKDIDDINDGYYYEAICNIVRETKYSQLREFHQANNETFWKIFRESIEIGAFYVRPLNKLSLPAGILQGIFFGANRPKYMNYGAIGSIIGHEITHGFDNEGRMLDDKGNEIDWWDEKALSAFLERSQCMIEQYGNYTEPTTGLKLNGTLTLSENIADNGGIKESYYAYQEFVKEHGIEPLLPGLNFTQDQMFWISLGQVWCSVFSSNLIESLIENDEHSPASFRVNGPLRNIPEFSNDFKCPENSFMNPTEKCIVW